MVILLLLIPPRPAEVRGQDSQTRHTRAGLGGGLGGEARQRPSREGTPCPLPEEGLCAPFSCVGPVTWEEKGVAAALLSIWAATGGDISSHLLQLTRTSVRAAAPPFLLSRLTPSLAPPCRGACLCLQPS